MYQDGYLSKRTKKALILVGILGVIIVFTPRILYLLFPPKKLSLTVSDIAINESVKVRRKQFKKTYKPSYSKKSKFKAPTVKFDPNQYKEADWLNLGVSEKQASSIVKFAQRGLYDVEGLEKIYALPKELLALVKDSLFFPEKFDRSKAYKEFDKVKKQRELEVNTASLEEFISISGIGEFTAQKIIERREKLGGFVSIDQLEEIYPLNKEKVESLKPFLKLLVKETRTININTADVQTLKNHPYINYSVANSIVKMRAQKGGFQKIEELKESALIDEEFFQKIKAYVSL